MTNKWQKMAKKLSKIIPNAHDFYRVVVLHNTSIIKSIIVSVVYQKILIRFINQFIF